MNKKIDKLKERKREFSEKLFLAQGHKKEVIEKTQKLSARLNVGEITRKEYIENLKNIFGERSPEKWVEYYEKYIQSCKKQLQEDENEIRREKTKKIAFILVPLLLLFFLVFLFYQFSNKGITGSTVERFKESYSENVGKEFISSGNYVFNAKQIGILNYLKTSGEVEGEGNVKIFLQGNGKEFLVLDSSEIEFGKVTLTGGVITGFGSEGAESSSDSVGSGGAEDSGSSAGSSDASSSSGSSAGSSIAGSVDASSSSGSENNAETTSVSDAVNSENEEDFGGSVSGSGNNGESTQGNGENTQMGGEITTGTNREGTGTEAKTQEENQNASGKIKNETAVSNAGNERQGNNEINGDKIKKFGDYCKETCELSAYNLSEISYTLRVEIIGKVKLKLDKIKYELELEKEVATENLTNVTIPELNLTNVTIPESNLTNVTIPESNLTNVTIPESNLTNITEKPILLKEIPNLEIKVNGSYNLTLSDYFFNAEEFEFYERENISFVLANESLEIIPEKNFEGNRTGKIKVRNEFGEVESNGFNISVVSIVVSKNVSTNITTLQYKAIINRPTKWLKILNASSLNNESLKFELPKEASNISVKTGDEVGQALNERENYENLVKDSDKQEMISGGITGNVALDLQEGKGIITKVWNWFFGLFRRGITGKVISEKVLQEQITQTTDGQLVDVTNIVKQTNASEIAVEYYTDGPKAVEENLTNGKRVLVSGKDELNYIDILAFSEVPELKKVGEESKIKVYWREQKEFVNFSAQDLDGNGFIDYVEWLVPHLSNQTYDIILIIKAEHLDENRTFIKDIYEEVKELDGNWSETISNGEYVRVTFEKNLTNENDITVYARALNDSGTIEVYEFNDSKLITTFPIIENESYYKIYLINLSDSENYSQGTFDLKVILGSLEFDHIIDPTLTLNVSDASSNLNITVEAGNFSHLSIGDNTIGFINSSNVVVYFPFDTNTSTTTAFDYSGNNLDAVFVGGGPKYDSGFIGNSYFFSGSTALSPPNSFLWNSSNSITISAWIYKNTTALGKAIFGKGVNGNLLPDISFAISAQGGLLRFGVSNSSDSGVTNCDSTDAFQNFNWTHVAAVYNTTTQSVYINGVLDKSCIKVGDIKKTAGGPGVGAFKTSGGAYVQYWIGWIDEFIFLNVSLNDSQIAQIFNNQSSKFFPRGEEIFSNLNGSSDGTEQRVNITINASMNFGSMINVSVGRVSGGSYVYDKEYAFVNNVSNNIPLATPNNYSLKFIFYAGNQSSNSFISPTLENYILGTSYAGTSITPYTVLNGPANASIFYTPVGNVSLNASVFDTDGDTINVEIYGVNSTSTGSFYNHSLLYQGIGVANNTIVTYNWSNVLFIPGYSDSFFPEPLYHLDNNSKIGENDTNIVADFYPPDVGGNLNLTPVGNAFTNMTGGKFGGAWTFDGDEDYLNSSGSFTVGSGYATYSAWVKRAGNSSTGYETIVQDNDGSGGYSLTASCNDSLLQFAMVSSSPGQGLVKKVSISNSIISDGQWHLVTGTYSVSLGQVKLYVDGVLKANGTSNMTTTPGTHRFRIGGHPTGTFGTGGGTSCDASDNAGSFNGTIDDVYYIENVLDIYISTSDMYKLKKGKYFWKVNVTDSLGLNNESETREFVVRDTSYVFVNSSMNCTDLLTETTTYYYGYSCTAAGYSTCVGLNSDLNISSSGVLNVPSSCNIQFNASSNGGLNFIVEGTGKLNLTGGNITSTNISNKFNFKTYKNLPTYAGNNGSISFFNVTNSLNLSDSRINFYNLTISDRMSILNSTDISLGTYTFLGSGRLDRQWRLNVSVYASGAVVSGANVTARNVSLTAIDSKLTASNGASWFNLSEYYDVGGGKVNQNNYTINVTSGGYTQNSTTINLTSDNSTSVSLTVLSLIQVSGTETLHDIFTRVNDPIVFNNLSSAGRPCRYAATASINITTGHLVMESCTLEMNSSVGGQYDLIVGGGILTANYSNITRFGSNNYDFYTASSNETQVILKNSFVSYAGSGTTDNLRGVTLNTNNVTFINNTLSSSPYANLDLVANGIVIERSSLIGPASAGTDFNIYIRGNNSIVLDSNLSNPSQQDVFIDTKKNITLLNTNHTSESAGGTNASLFKKWYTNVRVVNSLGQGVENANVSFYNVSGAITQSALTNSSGDIVQQNVTQYISNGTTRAYWTNYNITAVANGFNTTTINVNITQSANYTIGPSSQFYVSYVQIPSTLSPTEGDIVNANFNFTVTRGDGANSINDSLIKANFTRGIETARINNSCSLVSGENTTSTRNYTCTIGMWYFDAPGTWNLTIFAQDTNNNVTTNITSFTYDSLASFKVSPTLLSWGTISPIDTNKTPTNGPWLMNNTGNVNFTRDYWNITLTAINLYGQTTTSEFLDVGNMTVDFDTGGSPSAECNGTRLVNGSALNLTDSIGVTLPRGNNSLNYGNGTSGQEQLYLCLAQVPSEISQQVYSTSGAGSWTIRIFTAVFAVEGADRFRRRKKNKKAQVGMQVDLGEVLKGVKVDLSELLNIIGKVKDVELRDNLLVKEKEHELNVPIEIFKLDIGAAESLCKYLKENKGMKFSQIGKLIGRDQRTIWNNYNNALKKSKDKLIIKDDNGLNIPVEIFNNDKSILESVVYYLREEGYKNIEIAKMLGKDARNVWTIYNRARKKSEK